MTSSRSVPVLAVTGGGSGIGLATATRWVHDGGDVVLLDFSQENLDRAVAQLGEDRARGVLTDVTNGASVDAAYASISEVEGRLDGVLNGAGVSRPAASAEITDEQFGSLVDLHLNGTLRSSRAAYPLLSRSPRAAIVNISSVAASSGMPQRAPYCAAKAGIEGLTRTLAVEWAPAGIRVNAVAPGYVRTALTDNLIAEGRLNVDRIVERTPLKRLAEPREISSVISFLLGEGASYVNGHSLVVDGGMTIDGDWY